MKTWTFRVYHRGNRDDYTDHKFEDTDTGTSEKYNMMINLYTTSDDWFEFIR